MKLEDNLNDLHTVSDLLSISTVASDLVTSLCGEYLGNGAFRRVFEYNLDPRYVVKIEPLNTGCNMVEYMIWQEVKELVNNMAWVKDWFAPVKWISPNGKILLMERTIENDHKKRPNKVPKFLWDVKPDNFGWIKGKYVCHDYGQFYNMINYPKGMKKINWDKW